MAFALWLEHDLAWAAGTHEYRPMGVAVIAATDLFSARDFHPLRRPPRRTLRSFHGLFASLADVNSYLSRRRSQVISPSRAAARSRQLSVT